MLEGPTRHRVCWQGRREELLVREGASEQGCSPSDAACRKIHSLAFPQRSSLRVLLLLVPPYREARKVVGLLLLLHRVRRGEKAEGRRSLVGVRRARRAVVPVVVRRTSLASRAEACRNVYRTV